MIRPISKLSIFLATFTISSLSFALQGEVSGQISKIRSHDISVASDWLQIVGVNSAGACNSTGGLVAFLFKDDDRGKRHTAMAMAAYASGKPILVGFDDANLQTNGWCYIRYINY